MTASPLNLATLAEATTTTQVDDPAEASTCQAPYNWAAGWMIQDQVHQSPNVQMTGLTLILASDVSWMFFDSLAEAPTLTIQNLAKLAGAPTLMRRVDHPDEAPTSIIQVDHPGGPSRWIIQMRVPRPSSRWTIQVDHSDEGPASIIQVDHTGGSFR
eukprot:gene16079-22218_t